MRGQIQESSWVQWRQRQYVQGYGGMHQSRTTLFKDSQYVFGKERGKFGMSGVVIVAKSKEKFVLGEDKSGM